MDKTIDELIEDFQLVRDAEIEIQITTRDHDGLIKLFRTLRDQKKRIKELKKALCDIIDEQPEPTTGYGKAVVEIAQNALEGGGE